MSCCCSLPYINPRACENCSNNNSYVYYVKPAYAPPNYDRNAKVITEEYKDGELVKRTIKEV